MQSSLREDYLEAIQVFSEKNRHAPAIADLGTILGKGSPEVEADINELVARGEVAIAVDNEVTLTARGRTISASVLKKHETLQCFLSEMLGMDALVASSEACTLEHTVSDETIDLLGEYLKKPRRVGRDIPRRGCEGPGCPSSCSPYSLLDFNEGDEVVVRCILGQSCAKRLLDLGVVPGEQVKIRRKLGNQSLVLLVKGCDVALSPEIAAAVSVERSS